MIAIGILKDSSARLSFLCSVTSPFGPTTSHQIGQAPKPLTSAPRAEDCSTSIRSVGLRRPSIRLKGFDLIANWEKHRTPLHPSMS